MDPVTAGPPLPDRRVLRDARADAELRRVGLVVVDLIGPEQLDAIAEVIRDLYRGESSGQHYSLLSTDFDYRRSLFETVPGLLADLSADLFDDYAFCATSLAFKWPGEDSVLGPHQDISMADETRFRSYNLWIPLVDTDEHNGAVRFLKGSHRVLDNLRTMPGVPDWFRMEIDDIPLEDFEAVPVRRGQAIVFDHALLHCSGPNFSDECRAAVIAAYRPAEADLLHYFVPDPDRDLIEVYDASGDFFERQLVGQAPPEEPLRTMRYYGTPRSREDIVRLSRVESPPPRSVVVRNEAVPSAGRPATWSVADSEPVGPDVGPTMVDAALEEQVRRDGYAVFDAFDPAEVERLRVLAEEIYPGEREGFHASNFHNDHLHRRQVHELIGPALERGLSPHLADYRHIGTLSTMKFPGEASGFVVHQDWKFCDERRFRGVNVWVPLTDTDERNGGMLVLPGSHRFLNAVRCGPDFPDAYQAPGLQVTWDEMLPVPVRAGQALLFDQRLLHSSGPNLSEELRGAVVAVMTPRQAQLYHWYLPDPADDRLEVLSIDERFLIDYEIGRRPDFPAVDEVPFVPDTITRDELVALCGGPFPGPRGHGPGPGAGMTSMATGYGARAAAAAVVQADPHPGGPSASGGTPALGGTSGLGAASGAGGPMALLDRIRRRLVRG